MGAGAGMTEVKSQFVNTFETNAIFLAQQKYSKFRSRVVTKDKTADKHSFRTVAPRTGAVNDRANVGLNAGKRAATQFEDTVYGERVVSATPRDTADSFSKPDLNRMLEDTQSILYTQMVAQMGRKFDSVILAAMYAQALDTLGGTYDFGASGTTPEVGDGTAVLNLANVLAMLEAYNTDNIDPEVEKFIAVSPKAVTALLAEQKYTSVDYANARALQSGKLVEQWCGFTWMMHTGLTGPQAGQKWYPTWTRESMGLLILQDIQFQAAKSPMNKFDTIVQLDADFGAVRIQDDQVKRFVCSEA